MAASPSLLARLGRQAWERAASPSGSCLRCEASAVASTSAVRLPASAQAVAAFHSSAPVAESKRKRAARIRKRENLEQRNLKETLLANSRPDPVLGHQLTEEGRQLWNKSKLKKLLLDKEKVWSGEASKEAQAKQGATEAPGPALLNFGLRQADRKLLFQDLPQVMVEDRMLDSPAAAAAAAASTGGSALGSDSATPTNIMEDLERTMQNYTKDEQTSVDLLSSILDLRNASGKGIQVENTRRIVEAFQRPRKAGEGQDTGSPEVQAAVLTYRIRNLYEHLAGARHDNSNRRAMNILVHQRAKILKYLKRVSPSRYQSVLPALGLEARAVEGELILPGKPKITAR